MPRSCIKISDTVVFGIPRSASSSYIVSHWPLLIVACTHSTFSGVPFVAGLLEHDHFQQILDKLWSICATLLFVLDSLHGPESLLNHPNSFRGGMFKLNAKFDTDSLLYLLSRFECDDHTVHMLTQQHLPPPLTSTVKSLFTHTHSSPFLLAARLHRCCANHSYYINNGWAFSGQTLYSWRNPKHRIGNVANNIVITV